MYRIIGGDQQQYGPVSAEDVRRWISEGRLNERSLVQPEGSTEWKALSEFPELAQMLPGRAQQTGPRVGAALPVPPESWAAEILARPAELNIGACLSASWQLMTRNFGSLLAPCALIWAVGLSQFIPMLGLVYMVMAGVFYGGLYLFFLKRIRGEHATVADAFSGFNIAFGQLVLAGFLTWLLTAIGFVCCCIIPGIYLIVAWVFSVPLVADKRLEFWSAMELSRKVVTKIWFQVLALLVLVFLPTILAHVYAGIRTGFSAWPMFQHSVTSAPQDFGRFLQLMVQFNTSVLGLKFFARVVLLINLPFAVGALMYAYESLFGPRTTAAA